VLALRIAPPLALRRPTRLVQRNMLVYRHTFIVIFSGFFEPLFYLFSMGFGVGALIGDVPLGDGRTVPYAVFVAPALLASSAMNGAIYETSNNFFYKLKYAKLYDAIITTPMSLQDVARGEVMWALMRGSLYSIGFLGVVAALGVGRPWFDQFAARDSGVPGVDGRRLRLRRGGHGCHHVHPQVARLRLHAARDHADVPLLGHLLPDRRLPAGPPGLRPGTPLYRGVHLIRAFTTGTLDPTLVVDLAYLLALGTIGLAITSRRLGKLLLAYVPIRVSFPP
jgi:lipooligosaccharide transport system permease protein